jgi:signal transduction histidine kinase/CheY-like chemotaxis protein
MSDVGAKPRRWHQGVAGRLLIAFLLIVALTVAGTVLSIFRFSTLNDVLHRLVDVSLPAVKIALEIEARAIQVTGAASQLRNAEDGVALFGQTEKITAQIERLWAGLTTLRTMVGEDAPVNTRLQEQVAAIDAKVGELNRAVSAKIILASRRLQLADDLAEAVYALSGTIYEFKRTIEGAPLANLLIADISKQLLVLDTLAAQVTTASKTQQLDELRRRFVDGKERVNDDLTGLRRMFAADDSGISELQTSIEAVLDQIGGDKGLLVARQEELRAVRLIDTLQGALQGLGDDFRDQVQVLVRQAEAESSQAFDRSVAEITESRLWLILIAVSSLLLAVLVMWQFVVRYVVTRLRELSHSMLAVAQGHLTTPIPAAGPDELGDMSRALTVFRDNAREIRAAREEAERSRAEAEAASRTKSAFLANMSHELRTPLNAIIGYSEILVEDATDRGDKTSIADLEKIQGAGKHLLGLINDILDLSKIEAGRMDVYLEQVFLNVLIDEVKSIVEPMVRKNDNRLAIECAPDIGSMRTDLVKLKQGLINLLSNAAKFTKQGKVTLRVWRQREGDGRTSVKFAVADTGIGMNDEQMARLFQAFTQADSSTTRTFGGTGLGLAITKHFCTMLGGSIDVASKPGQGATFTISLPDRAAKHVAAEVDDRAAPSSGKMQRSISVLVVDDDPVVHDVLATTLGKEGYHVLHAHDGNEALTIMRKTPPDIVTLDVMMPGIDGWSVLGIMKSEPGLEHIPVIMLTIVDDRNLGFSLGASEFMTKPVDRSKLIALLRKLTPSAGRSVVLVVDDDADVRRVVKSAIEGVGLKSAEVGHGRAALNWLDENPLPALVVLDLMMPEVDGFEFLERVRGDERFADLPVVVLTAKELTQAERNFLVERTLLVLSKGAQPITSLGRALAAIAGRNRGRQPNVARDQRQ